MDFLRETPQSKGLADIHNLEEGYAVLSYNPSNKSWTFECNSWGMLYRNRGNAINNATHQRHSRFNQSQTNRIVVKLPNWKIVWSSWEEGKND